eukprot:s603_g28.t1
MLAMRPLFALWPHPCDGDIPPGSHPSMRLSSSRRFQVSAGFGSGESGDLTDHGDVQTMAMAWCESRFFKWAAPVRTSKRTPGQAERCICMHLLHLTSSSNTSLV